MAVFNFTVRATDSQGSYADQQFNITVNNTQVVRYMAVTASDTWTSNDGSTWTQRTGASGYTCAYGNSFWLTIKTTGGLDSFKSTDGINYVSIAAANQTYLDDTGAATTAPSGFDQRTKLKFFNGKFYIPVLNVASKAWDLWYTSDGVTWQRKRLYQDSQTSNISLALYSVSAMRQIELCEDNGTMLIPFPVYNTNTSNNYQMTAVSGYTKCMGWSTPDGINYTPIIDSANSFNSNYGAGWITRFNGVYFAGITMHGAFNSYVGNNYIAGGSPNTSYLYSTDGMNWTAGSIASLGASSTPYQTFCAAPRYLNGQLILVPGCTNTAEPTSALYFYTSVDGLTWTQNTTKSIYNQSTPELYNRKLLVKNGICLIAADAADGTDTTSSNSASNNGFRLSVDGGNTFTSVNVRSTASLLSYLDIAGM